MEQGDVATIVDNAQRLRAELDALPPGQARQLRRDSADALVRAEQQVGTIPTPDGGSVTDGAAVEEPVPDVSAPEAPSSEPGSGDGSTDGSTDGGPVEGVAPSDGTVTTLVPADEGDEGAGAGEGAERARTGDTGDTGVSAEPPPETAEPPPGPEIPPAEAGSSGETSVPEPEGADPATEGPQGGDEPHEE
jgi:hypothetical protein